MDVTPSPRREGITAEGRPVDLGKIAKVDLASLGRSVRLADLTKDFFFFTPAVLYLYGELTDAPMSDYAASVGGKVTVYRKAFNRQIFSGLEAPNGSQLWNHTLWSVSNEYKQSLTNWLVALMLVCPVRKAGVAVGMSELTIVDPLAGEPHEMTVAAFGVRGSVATIGLAPGNPPYLVRLPGDAKVKSYVDALYAGENPLVERRT